MDFLKQILSAIKETCGVQPEAFETYSIDSLPAITYTANRQSDNGAVETWRLEIRATADTLLEALEIDRKISTLLVTVGDEPQFGCNPIVQNGGGVMNPLGKSQAIAYYDITKKS